MVYALGCDYSYQQPTAVAIKDAGYTFVMRYLSYEPGKNATVLEIMALHSLGIGVGFVWETTADRPLYGAAAGAADGAEAGRQADALGIPRSVPLFYALDTDDRGHPGWQAAVKAYGNAFAHASGHFAFPYGSGRVIDYIGAGWQTQAWSGSYVSPHAMVYQRAGGARIAGTDEDVLFNSYALWLPGDNPAVDAYLHALADAAKAKAAKAKAAHPTLTATGYPDITGSDHTHPKALAELKMKLHRVNPKADTSTDETTCKTVEEFRAFFKIQDPAPRVGDHFWQVLDYLTTVENE